MTEEIIDLLQQYGKLVASMSQLAEERPGSSHESLETYYKSLGAPLTDEPTLVVKISADNEIHFLHEGEHDVSIWNEQGEKTGVVTVWELPEDEFWFFKAFRPALFDLDKQLPGFMFEMAITCAYALFESYLTEILHRRLKEHPRLMGGQREIKYEQVFLSGSREDLIDSLIAREMRELLYLSLPDLLQKMRGQMGFRSLGTKYDEEATYWSLVRNCLLHNRGIIDAKLASLRTTCKNGERLTISDSDVSGAVNTLRKFAYQIDQVYEGGSNKTAAAQSHSD
jgi:hypothetical protein